MVCNTTHDTNAAWLVEQDFDWEVKLYEEYPSRLLFPTQNAKDVGANDAINFAKARMTSFYTSTRYFDRDEETGKRRAVECFSSQHIVTIGATNQFLQVHTHTLAKTRVMEANPA